MNAVNPLPTSGTSEIQQLLELPSPDDYVCSLRWLPSSSNGCLAVGDSTGRLELWDTNQLQRLRVMQCHSDRIGALAWNQVRKRNLH